MFTKSEALVVATDCHSRRVSFIGLHESATTLKPNFRLSAAIRYAKLYPSPSTRRSHKSRSAFSMVSIRKKKAPVVWASPLARDVLPVPGSPPNMNQARGRRRNLAPDGAYKPRNAFGAGYRPTIPRTAPPLVNPVPSSYGGVRLISNLSLFGSNAVLGCYSSPLSNPHANVSNTPF